MRPQDVCDNRPGVESSVPAVEYHFPTHNPASGQDVAALGGAGVQALTNPGERGGWKGCVEEAAFG